MHEEWNESCSRQITSETNDAENSSSKDTSKNQLKNHAIEAPEQLSKRFLEEKPLHEASLHRNKKCKEVFETLSNQEIKMG